MSLELFEFIKNFLDCRVSFENIYIIYEDNLDFISDKEDLDLERFNFNIHLKQFSFK